MYSRRSGLEEPSQRYSHREEVRCDLVRDLNAVNLARKVVCVPLMELGSECFEMVLKSASSNTSPL